MNRNEFARLICDKLDKNQDNLREQFITPNRIKSFVQDDLLPAELTRDIYKAFPPQEKMRMRKSLREYKNVASQLNLYNPILEEITFAFQDSRIVQLVSSITGIKDLIPDALLYAGGISLMGKGNFLNPHLDNSHDNDRKNYRVLNLLYYVTPNWAEEYGGNLELWDNGVKQAQRTIVSKFNRLTVMITNKSSYHSVSEVKNNEQRCCVSNYYFSPHPVTEKEYFHVTSFRGRPGQPIRDIALQADVVLRNGIRKILKKGLFKPWQVYKKD